MHERHEKYSVKWTFWKHLQSCKRLVISYACLWCIYDADWGVERPQTELALWRYAGEVIPGAERATACAVCSCTLYINSTLELEECVIVQINHCVNNTSLYKL